MTNSTPWTALQVSLDEGVPIVHSPQVAAHRYPELLLIDVRRPDEFNAELGHIAGARLVTLGPELETFLSQQDRASDIVFICRSGVRSAGATLRARQLGFERVANLTGGMIDWNRQGLPVERT